MSSILVVCWRSLIKTLTGFATVPADSAFQGVKQTLVSYPPFVLPTVLPEVPPLGVCQWIPQTCSSLYPI